MTYQIYIIAKIPQDHIISATDKIQHKKPIVGNTMMREIFIIQAKQSKQPSTRKK